MTSKRTTKHSSSLPSGKGKEKEPQKVKRALLSPKSKLKMIKRKRESKEAEGELDSPTQFENSIGSKQHPCVDYDDNDDIHLSRGSSFFKQKASSSAKTVAELGISLANESELRASVASLPERLVEVKKALIETYKSHARDIAVQWRAGFSVLFYGYGSKFELLKMLVRECSAGYPALVIDALSPRVNYRSILMNTLGVVRDCKPSNFSSMNDDELLKSITEEAKHQRIFVMVSNIDGPSLRSLEQQRALSEFSRIPRLHFGASIDHVNAPLIWDLQTKDKFAWLWHHVPTFKPYIREASLSSLPSLFLGRKYVCVSVKPSIHDRRSNIIRVCMCAEKHVPKRVPRSCSHPCQTTLEKYLGASRMHNWIQKEMEA